MLTERTHRWLLHHGSSRQGRMVFRLLSTTASGKLWLEQSLAVAICCGRPSLAASTKKGSHALAHDQFLRSVGLPSTADLATARTQADGIGTEFTATERIEWPGIGEAQGLRQPGSCGTNFSLRNPVGTAEKEFPAMLSDGDSKTESDTEIPFSKAEFLDHQLAMFNSFVLEFGEGAADNSVISGSAEAASPSFTLSAPSDVLANLTLSCGNFEEAVGRFPGETCMN